MVKCPPTMAMREWFKLKYKLDLSGFVANNCGYYEHHVYNFVRNYFTEEVLKGKNVLDLGCGPGFYTFFASSRGAKTLGVDNSRYLINKANKFKRSKKAKNTRFIHGRFQEVLPKLMEGTFDIIFAIDTIVTFNQALRGRTSEQYRIFKYIGRLLNDTGRLYVIEAHPCFHSGHLAPVEFESNSSKHDRIETCFVTPRHYKLKYIRKDEKFHFSTLEEMTRCLSKGGMAVSRIYEPKPDSRYKSTNPLEYQSNCRYPLMIVYEACKC